MTILAGTTTTNGGTIVTIPAASTWTGTITLSAAVSVDPGESAITASAVVSLTGDDAQPAAGDYLRVDLAAPAASATGSGTNDSAVNTIALTINANTYPVNLVLNTVNTTVQSATAYGIY